MKTLLSAGLLTLALASAPAMARNITIDDVTMLSRVSSPALSPDGRWLVWQQRETDLAANKGRNDLWRLDLRRKGAKPEPLVAEADVNETAPQFSRDGARVYFQSDKGGDDAVWSVPIAGGATRKLTAFKGGFGGFKVSPTDDRLLIWADRKPGATSLTIPPEPKDPDAGQARTYDRLFVRHWDTWADGTRSQLFVLPLGPDGALGDGVALEHGLVGDTPSRPNGGGEEVAWSADGRTVYFALREAGRIEALSTNLDIFAVAADGSSPPVNLTAANMATDTLPTVSPDGRSLAYVAMKRPGFEADRQVLMLRDLTSGKVRALTEAWDRSVETIAWSPDSRRIYVTAEDTQENPVWTVDPASGKVARLTQEGNVSAVVPTARGAVIAINSLTAPDDFFLLDGKAAPRRLTAVNAARLAGIEMPTVSRFHFTGAKGDTVWGYAVRPNGLVGSAPIAFMVHGGPQGSSNNSWSYRWNPAVFAGHGYGLVAIDFHGSTGYGQAFTDAISNDWGGAPLADLKAGMKAATATYAWLDSSRACALGASYGGYMMNWIEGNWPDGFRCIVQHDGVFDARAMAYETDELWFDSWEHGGRTYYQDPQAFERFNPVNFVAQWKTPMLVITGEKDFRIPYTQGIAAFTALQLRDIPSRLVVNPNENHWVLKPTDSRQWYREVFEWLDRWTGAAAK